MRETLGHYVLCNERERINVIGGTDLHRSIVDRLLLYIHMLQLYTAAMHQSLYMQDERTIEGQVDSASVP